MQGLFGCLTSEGGDLRFVSDMAEILQHDSGINTKIFSLDDGCIGLASLALSLSIPSSFEKTIEKLTVVLDGYLTNSSDLQASFNLSGLQGAELIASLFQKVGELCFPLLEGSFIILIADQMHKIVYLVSDAYASRPLYYSNINKKLYFGPELKCFLPCKEVPRIPDWTAIGDFFLFGNVWGTKTFLKDVSLLEGGAFLKWTAGDQLGRQTYWKLDPITKDETPNLDYWIDLLDEELRILCTNMLDFPGRKSLMLSGGFDSRNLACYLSEANVKFNALQVCLPGIPNQDQILSTQVAAVLGIPVQVFEYDFSNPEALLTKHLDVTDGQMPCTLLLSALPFDRLAEQTDIVMNGQPGNLIFGDLATLYEQKKYRILERGIQYERWRKLGSEGLFASVALEIFQRDRPIIVRHAFPSTLVDQMIQDARVSFENAYEETKNIYAAKKFDYLFFFNYYWRRSMLPDWGCSHYLHVVKPYLIRKKLTELYFQLPMDWKFSRLWDATNLQKRFPGIAEIPKLGAWPSIFRYPDEWVYRDIYDIPGLTRSVFRNAFDQFIYSKQMKERPYLNWNGVETLWKNHLQGFEDNSIIIGSLISLEAFFRKFID